MRPIILCVSAIVLTTACAAAPDYREASRSGAQGYSAQPLESNRYMVTYTGDRHQSVAEVQNYALLRAAELTMETGNDWFEVVATDTDTDVDVRERFAGRGYTTETQIVRDCGLLGCTTRARPVAVATDTYELDEERVYDHALEIILHKGPKPRDNPRAYDAADTAANLRAALD